MIVFAELPFHRPGGGRRKKKRYAPGGKKKSVAVALSFFFFEYYFLFTTTTGVYFSPLRVPDGPVGCTPSPITPGTACDPTISWLSQTESMLVLDWAQERELKRTAKAKRAEEDAARRREQQTSEATPGSQLVAEAGLNLPRLSSSSYSDSLSSSWSEEADDLRREAGLVPLECDHASFPFNRSCGVVFEQPTAFASASAAADAAPRGRATPLPTTEVPVGVDYYAALQKAWSRQPEILPNLPPIALEAEIHMAEIQDVMSADADSEELNPPVPLGLMVGCFAEDWRDDGLYDAVQKREEALSSQAQK